jgi:acyl-CoA thioester hydrolase
LTSLPAHYVSRFSLPIRVYFQDTDAGGVVFHGTYLSFFERARTEWLRSFGVELNSFVEEEGVLFIVRRMELAYRKPAKLDDRLEVSAELAGLGRAQFTLRQEVMRGDELLVKADVNLACVQSGSLRPVPLPESVRSKLDLVTSPKQESM